MLLYRPSFLLSQEPLKVVEEPPAIALPDQPTCEECKEKFGDSFLLQKFDYLVCDGCRWDTFEPIYQIHYYVCYYFFILTNLVAKSFGTKSKTNCFADASLKNRDTYVKNVFIFILSLAFNILINNNLRFYFFKMFFPAWQLKKFWFYNTFEFTLHTL